MAKRINPFTDFGFKYIFGQEQSKAYLIDFLNILLENVPGFKPIKDVTYRDKERIGESPYERGVIYDIHCTTDSGDQFIVEMQNGQQGQFIDRSLYYCARAIDEQGRRGRDWMYELMPVYSVAFINFDMAALGDNVRTDVVLCDSDTKEQISDKIRLIYIQLTKFRKTQEQECGNAFDWWLYNLINMETMEQLSFIKEHGLFKGLSEMTEYAALDTEQRRAYDADLKAYRDLNSSLHFAASDGFARGEAKGFARGEAKGLAIGEARGEARGRENEKMKTAKLLFDKGMDMYFISQITGLSHDEIRNAISRGEED